MFIRRTRRGAAGDTLGIEEEFFLTDFEGVPVPRCSELIGALSESFKPELRATQIEFVTPVHTQIVALTEDLRRGRADLAKAALDLGILAMPTGTPVFGDGERDVSLGDRYQGINDLYAGLLSGYSVCACQIHVGVEDDDLAIAVLNHIRPWLPILLAIGANSPFVDGRDTGHDSWRIIEQSHFPCSGMPPYSRSADEYEDRLTSLVDVGTLFDDRTCFWIARRSPRYPTIEFRVADAAATVDDAILQALLSRALVRTAVKHIEAGMEAPQLDDQLALSAVWTAARFGLTGPAIDPVTAESMSGMSRVRELVECVRPSLVETGDYRLARRLLKKVETHGNGATRQRAAAKRGMSAVLEEFALKPI